jgi:hypothetical protein
VYRFAAYDAETLYYRLHDLDGVHVERVQRGIVGPALYSIPDDGGSVRIAEPTPSPVTEAWGAALAAGRLGGELAFVVSFATDIAAEDVREEKSNDPLAPLLRDMIEDKERARYEAGRKRFAFRVYKDRKFVATRNMLPLVQAVCAAMGTRNLTYPL